MYRQREEEQEPGLQMNQWETVALKKGYVVNDRVWAIINKEER
jgi:hypothetical protein